MLFRSVFGNCGFMGLPFLNTLFGVNGEILVYCAVVIAVFNLLCWTLGIYVITGDKKFISVKKAVLNPITVPLILGLLLFFILKAPLTDVFTEGSAIDMFFEKLMYAFNLLSEAVTPISMTVLGINLAEMNFKEIFLNVRAFVASLFKLVVMPFIVIAVFLIIPGVSELIKYTVFFTLAMPTATNTMLFSEQYGGNVKEASSSVLLSTILSILTISLIFLAFKGILGI